MHFITDFFFKLDRKLLEIWIFHFAETFGSFWFYLSVSISPKILSFFHINNDLRIKLRINVDICVISMI